MAPAKASCKASTPVNARDGPPAAWRPAAPACDGTAAFAAAGPHEPDVVEWSSATEQPEATEPFLATALPEATELSRARPDPDATEVSSEKAVPDDVGLCRPAGNGGGVTVVVPLPVPALLVALICPPVLLLLPTAVLV